MNCKICEKPFVSKSHKQLLCGQDCIKENKRRISLESYYRTKGEDIPKRERTYNSDYEKISKLEQKRRYRQKNKEKIKERSRLYIEKSHDIRKDYHLKKHFNITLSDYNQMLKNQNNGCLICLRHESEFSKKLAVDHCHETGKVRGILCHLCNRAIGALRDSVENLQRAIDYLNKSREPETLTLTNPQNYDTINDLENQ